MKKNSQKNSNFRKLFVRFVLSKNFPEIGRAETIRLVRTSSNFELSSRFFGGLKIFIGQGSLYALEPIFQTPHYYKTVSRVSRVIPANPATSQNVKKIPKPSQNSPKRCKTAQNDPKRFQT